MPTDAEVAFEKTTSTEPVIAWRAWALTGRHDGRRLHLRPVAGRTRPWPPMKPAVATCKLGRMHVAPSLECTCGLHGAHDTDILRRTKDPAVLGTVALWGRVIEHEHGYRARFAYPQRLQLVCLLCFWQWGEHGDPPCTVAVLPRGRLIPFCEPHRATAVRYGLRPRRLLPAGEIEQRLRATYAVDPLNVALTEASLRV